jgi:hypothetical protein
MGYLIGTVFAVIVAIPVLWLAWQVVYVWLPPEWAAYLGAAIAGFCAGGLLASWYWTRLIVRDPDRAVRQALAERRLTNRNGLDPQSGVSEPRGEQPRQ